MAESIAIASDHAGYEMKTVLASELRALGFDVLDLGTNGGAPVDYPDFAGMLATALADGRVDRGVLVCGSGIGISIAANRHRHVRAALCHDTTYARLARQHNNANVLVVGGTRHFGTETAKDILRAFFSTNFEGGRHAPRVEKLSHA
jgi:ribose 5-phosphate isomerase B